jgi:hypothetical protein
MGLKQNGLQDLKKWQNKIANQVKFNNLINQLLQSRNKELKLENQITTYLKVHCESCYLYAQMR